MARGLHRLWALLSVIDHDALAFTPWSPYLHRPLHSIIIVTLLSYLLTCGNNKSTCQDVFILSPSTLIFNSRPVDYPVTSSLRPASGPGGSMSFFISGTLASRPVAMYPSGPPQFFSTLWDFGFLTGGYVPQQLPPQFFHRYSFISGTLASQPVAMYPGSSHPKSSHLSRTLASRPVALYPGGSHPVIFGTLAS